MRTHHALKRMGPALLALVLLMLWNVTPTVAQEKPSRSLYQRIGGG